MTSTSTVQLLSTSLENEAKNLLQLISELQNEDVFDFALRLAELSATSGRSPTDEILNVAHNIKNIDAALEGYYSV